MNIEGTRDGDDGTLYYVQTRPEAVALQGAAAAGAAAEAAPALDRVRGERRRRRWCAAVRQWHSE